MSDSTPEEKAKLLLIQGLDGRTASAHDVLSVNLADFVVGDTVNATAVNKWVADHSRPRVRDEIPARNRQHTATDQYAGREEAERRFGNRTTN